MMLFSENPKEDKRKAAPFTEPPPSKMRYKHDNHAEKESQGDKMTDYTKILRRGRKNAIPAPDLAYMVGLKSTRALRADIAKARAEGQLICSSTKGGYYLPETRQEIQDFIRTMEGHAKGVFKALRSARAAMQQVEGQISLSEETPD